MNDCPKVEYRDRLPELVHGCLDARDRDVVMAHVAECGDCRAELELLRQLRAVLAAAPRVDVGRIVQALPAPGTVVPPSVQRTFVNWRIAAAAVVLLAGGALLARYVRRDVTTPTMVASGLGSATSGASASTLPATGDTSGTSSAGVAEPGSDSELAVGGGLSDLSPSELTSLLGEIERLEPLPQTEPDIGAVSTEAPGDSP